MGIGERFCRGWSSAALVAIAALTIGGALFLRSAFVEIRAEVPQIEVNKLRQGFVALGHLHRLRGAVQEAVQSQPISSEERTAIRAALDFVFVRAEHFRQVHRETERMEEAGRILELMERIVRAGDTALAGGPGDLERFAQELDGLIDRTRIQILRYVDAQHQAQRRPSASNRASCCA